MAFPDDILGGASRASIGEIGGDPIVLDASVSETHSVSGEVSDHPVETGVDIVDHYRVLPRGLQLEGVVTNSPLTVQYPGASLINSAIGLINGDVDPSANAWKELQRFFDKAVVLDISTSLENYTNMVLTSLDVTRNSGTTNGLFFTLTAREIKFVDTAEGAAITLPVVTVGQAKKSAGKATNTTATAPQATQTSALAQGLDAVTGLF